MVSTLSYLYTDEGSLLFSEAVADSDSLLPPIKIDGKKVLFLLDEEMQCALFYQKKYISSFQSMIKLIKLPSKLDKELLEKIAIIANYFCHGTDYTYLKDSVKQEKKGLVFRAYSTLKGHKPKKVSLSTLDATCTITTEYE